MILTNEQIDELADATVEDFEDALLAHARKSNAELVRQNLEIERLRNYPPLLKLPTRALCFPSLWTCGHLPNPWS